jgi:rhamnosyltransferase
MSVVSAAGEGKSKNLLDRACIIIPTYNAGRFWGSLAASLEAQGVHKRQVLVIDSSSSDNTRELVARTGYRLRRIAKEDFRHGATRQMAAELTNSEFLIFLTQDASPIGADSFAKLLSAFEDPEVGAVYGRQLAHPEAHAIDRHARLFNYPETSEVRSFEDRERLGFRAAFFSNSFSAYRRSALDQVGGFPSEAIVSEEVTVAARMLMQHWKIAYCAEAEVYHSHHMTMRQEFRRYFDIGVHHGNAEWLIRAFGGPGSEGRAFLLSQMRYLRQNRPLSIPNALARDVSKWVAYKLGVHERALPGWLKMFLSAQTGYWQDGAENDPPFSSPLVSGRNDLTESGYKQFSK